MTDETRRCEWCGDIAQGACDCPASAEIERLRSALTDLCDAADSTNYPKHGPAWDRLWNCAVRARAAIKKTDA